MSQLSLKKVKRNFRLAKAVSQYSDYQPHKLGAVLIYKGSVLATGCNSNKTSPVQKHYNRERNFDVEANFAHNNSVHAEIACLNKIRYLDIDFSKAVLFVYREHRNGTKALAKPCKACTKFIKDLGIRHVYFTTEDGYGYEYLEGEQ